MFTGIIEELGEITAIEPSGDGVRAHRARPDGGVGCRARRLDRRQRRVPHRRRSGRRLVHRRRDEADPRHVDARRRRRRARASTSSAPPPPAAASAGTSCRATSTAPARCSRCARARSGASCGSSLPADLAPLVVDKGSIAVDGVSLTVSAVSDAAGPKPTALVRGLADPRDARGARRSGARAAGDRVNLETDILARHVQRLLAFAPQTTSNEGGSR